MKIGEWVIVEPTDCMTMLPIYECSLCYYLRSGYDPDPVCPNCGSLNMINTKKCIKWPVLTDFDK